MLKNLSPLVGLIASAIIFAASVATNTSELFISLNKPLINQSQL